MTVSVTWDVARPSLTNEAARAAVQAALAFGGRPGIRVDVVLSDDATLADLHGRFLGDPSPTDVIAFDLGEEGGGPTGEIYVSVECAARVAAERGLPLAREVALYLVHGALHLCGFDDHADADRVAMRAAEGEILENLGYPTDDAPHERDA